MQGCANGVISSDSWCFLSKISVTLDRMETEVGGGTTAATTASSLEHTCLTPVISMIGGICNGMLPICEVQLAGRPRLNSQCHLSDCH